MAEPRTRPAPWPLPPPSPRAAVCRDGGGACRPPGVRVRCADDAVSAVRDAVSRAFGEAVAGAAAGGDAIDVTVRSDGAAFEADLACRWQSAAALLAAHPA